MSHFYGEVINYRARTKCTRRGFKDSGMRAYVQGWNIGARVEISHEDGQDLIRVFITDGASGKHETMIYAGVK